MTDNPKYMSDQELLDELEWLVKNREMTESRGMVKPVIDPKVKLDSIKVYGKVKGQKGFGEVVPEDPNGRAIWEEMKAQMAKDKDKQHGEKDAM
jgi:hypothetical protein